MGYSILRHREIPCNIWVLTNPLSKGNEVDIPQAECGGISTNLDSLKKDLSKSIIGRTRKMVNYG